MKARIKPFTAAQEKVIKKEIELEWEKFREKAQSDITRRIMISPKTEKW